MRAVTLMERGYGDIEKANKAFQATLKNKLKHLDVNITVDSHEWMKVTLTGKDEEFAANYLISIYGSPHKLNIGDIITGRLANIDEHSIKVDVGLKFAFVLKGNFKHFGAGTPKQIASRFGFVKQLPVEVRVTGIREVEFTKKQIDTFWKWKKGTDRVIVNGATRGQIRSVLKRTGHLRDTIRIEKLGILEHSIICKKGTDAPGIISDIGPYLKSDLGCVRGSLNNG
jgi:hypothetical protein